jgi:four helix bundle protein
MKEPAKSFQDLVVWQKAHQFVLAIYRLTGTFPKSEMFGLSSQFRRSTVSIAANIAEGFKKRGIADKLRFFNIAQGSLEESRYYLILVEDLKYAECSELHASLSEVRKLLETYSQTIQNSSS